MEKELRETIAASLNIAATKLKSETPLNEMGMDSWDARESLFDAVDAKFGVDTKLARYDFITFSDVLTYVREHKA